MSERSDSVFCKPVLAIRGLSEYAPKSCQPET